MDVFQVSLILAILCLANFVSGDVFGLGKCPNVEAVDNFKVERFVGKWYDQYGFFNLWMSGVKCTTFNLAPFRNRDRNALRVNIKATNWFGWPLGREGELLAPEVAETSRDFAKWTLQYPFEFPQDFWVAATDYDNYAIIWSCRDFFLFNFKNIFVKTRTRTMDPKVEIQVKFILQSLLEAVDVDYTNVFSTDQKGCFHPTVQ